MASDSKKTISFSVESPEHKEYLTGIAIEKGFRNIGDMSRYALAKMFTSMKVPYSSESHTTGRDGQPGGRRNGG